MNPVSRIPACSRWLPWLAAFLLLLAVYSYFLPLPGPNELSKLNLTMALAKDGKVTIDDYCANSIDVATYDGHCYSNKAIGSSLLAVPWWALGDRLYRWGNYGAVRPDFPLWLVNAGAVSVPSALLALLVFAVAQAVSGSRIGSLAITAIFSFATIAFPFATVFYGHQTSAFFGFATFAVLWWRRETGSWRAPLLAGFLAGWGVLTEYPLAIVTGLAGVYLLSYPALRRRWWAYGTGCILGLTPLIWYNTVAFGRPWRFSYAFVQESAFAGHGSGVLGVGLPRLDAVYDILFSDHGLLVRSPFLVLAYLGLALWWRRDVFRREAILASSVVVAFFLYNAGYFMPMGGGYPIGPRFLVAMLPFLVLGLLFLPRWAQMLTVLTAIPSALVMLAITASMPKAQAGDPGTEYAIWMQRLQTGHIVPNWGYLKYGLEGAASLMPLLALVGGGIGIWLIWPRLAAAKRWARPGILVAAAIAYCAVASPPASVPPLYRPPALEVPGATRSNLVFGESLELLGFRVEPPVLVPGERVAVTLYWQAIRPVEEPLILFVHLLDKDHAVLGAWDTIPGAGAYPVQMWEPGQVLAETHWVWLKPDIAGPELCRLEVGWYRPGSGQRLMAATGQGTRVGDSPLLGRLPVKGPSPILTGMLPVGAILGEETRLMGWQPRNDGAVWRGRLFWEALAEKSGVDYTVFVQALRDGKVIAQYDSQPRGGRYPTSLWIPKEVVEDWFELPLPSGQRDGVSLIAGMYDLSTMQRLPIGDGNYIELPPP